MSGGNTEHDAERARVIRETDDRVWDMVGNLVHPAALYVLLQLLILDRFSTVAPWNAASPLSAPALALYAGQFLGAWAVLYTTFLRDMGLRSRGGTLLLCCAALTVLLQYLLPPATELPPLLAVLLPGAQAALGAAVFLFTWLRWRREKRIHDAALHTLALPLLIQQPQPGADVSAASGDFFSWVIWIIVLVPALFALLLAVKKRKATPTLPHTTDFTWQVDVVESRLPVLIHAYHAWSIGDRVIESQVVLLQERLAGRARVLWLDLDRNPVTCGKHATLEEKSVGFFREGELLWQSTGVQDAGTILAELERRNLIPAAAQ